MELTQKSEAGSHGRRLVRWSKPSEFQNVRLNFFLSKVRISSRDLNGTVSVLRDKRTPLWDRTLQQAKN